VWVHVGLATATWVVLLWTVAAAGRLVPRKAPVPSPVPQPARSGEPTFAPRSSAGAGAVR
jgi:hypothetical protein